jgi:AbrB family looped-hinge helix DNA binding protein
MSRVTSKRQVSIPKAIADQYGIAPGDEIEWIPAGDAVRVVRAGSGASGPLDTSARLKLFDQATARQRERDAAVRPTKPPKQRGWTRDDLYGRARAR